jgi:hypothetical protein
MNANAEDLRRIEAAVAQTKWRRQAAAKKTAKRELIDTGTDKRFVRRGAGGKFKESDDVGKSLT